MLLMLRPLSRLKVAVAACALLLLAACGGGSDPGNTPAPPPASTYAVGGTLSGMGTGASLVLRNNGGDDLALSANGAFTFPKAMGSGTAYAITVLAPPAGQTCTVALGSGTVANVNIGNVTVTCVASTTPDPATGPVAAFPGAQGAGAASVGGRGGAVHKVTSLADSGPGTLRACAQVASGPRTCVFTVGGIIRLQTPLWIDKPYLTVAGQTAPGGGVLITNADGAVLSSLVGVATHNVIWRYTRLRHQWRSACHDAAASECGALFSLHAGSHHVVADHNSLSWNQDEGFGIWRGSATAPDLRNVTLSMNLIAEGMASHSTGFIAGGTTSAMSAGVYDIDFHHNLVMNNNHRNPLLKIRSARVVNNLFYNQRFYTSQVGGGGEFDLVGNAYVRGPMTNVSRHEVQAFESSGADAHDGMPSIHLSGNIGWHQGDAAADQWLMASRVTGENGTQNGTIPDGWKRANPLPGGTHPITTHSAATVASDQGPVVPMVGASRRLTCAGAWVANRDAVDVRLISQYLTNTGISQLPADENTYGGIPSISSGEACVDTDSDGLPDEWELIRFGHLGQGPHGDADGDGYTHLEAYLQGL